MAYYLRLCFCYEKALPIIFLVRGLQMNSKTHLEFTPPTSAETLEIVSFSAEESLSEPFLFTVEMVAPSPSIAITTLVGEPIIVKILADDGTVARHCHGLIEQISQSIGANSAIAYTATLRPWLWQLRRVKNFRIFQNKTVQEILKLVFDDLGFSGKYKFSLQTTYTAREYCVQYDEDSFSFVSRLMEDEGIFYFFEHTASGHTMVIADDATAHTAITAPTSVRYAHALNQRSREDIIVSTVLERQAIEKKYASTDYHFITPATDLFVEVATTETQFTDPIRLYEYPGYYSETAVGTSRSNIRAQELEAPMTMLYGKTFVRTLVAGCSFTLAEHDNTTLNTTFVVHSLSFSVDTQSGYSNSIKAFPSTVNFRPPRITPRPRIAGYLSAMVIGKEGEEIWTDKYGRVKVKFPWDRDDVKGEDRTVWIRVAQMWAGKAWGAMFIPRIGMEVVVSFLDGNPDRPLIIGTVYNAVQSVPYELPKNQTRSTIKTHSSKDGDGYNELRFEDLKGSEEIFIHAEKDINTRVEHDSTDITENRRIELVHAGKHTFVQPKEGEDRAEVQKLPKLDTTAIETLYVKGGNRKITVVDDNSTETHINGGEFIHNVAKNYTLTVDKNFTHSVKENSTLKTDGEFSQKVGKNHTLTDDKNFTHSVGGNSSLSIDGKFSQEVTQNFTLTVSGSSLTIEAKGNLVIKGANVSIESTAGNVMIKSAAMVMIN